ncbi:MAG: hypothetical protein F4Y07_05120 [Gemmatimonadetes bacterium]|nr:hypothetical protein [Gemmatimonadota bacterium]
MNVSEVHSFLVLPAKGDDDSPVPIGTAVAKGEQLFRMVRDLCERAPSECRIEIVFRPAEDGSTENEARACLEEYANHPSLASARAIAARLQGVTTRRSGLGLLFLAKCASPSGAPCLVVSRFPADQGVVAQEVAGQLDVEYLERVFMKNAKAYKSVLYESTSPTARFEEGRAVDRQLSGPRELSQYWIGDFLASELRTTGPFGSRRLATAIRNAVNEVASLAVKADLVAAAQLLRNQHGRVRSAQEFLRRLGVSEEGVDAVMRRLPRPELMRESFEFDADEFLRHLRHRLVELSNGAMLMAEDARFDEVFESQPTDVENHVRYSTEGEIVDQRYRKTK